jgi:hypothetical protein
MRAASLAVALAGCLLFFGLAGFLSSSRNITGAYLTAIAVPFYTFFIFQGLVDFARREISGLWNF